MRVGMGYDVHWHRAVAALRLLQHRNTDLLVGQHAADPCQGTGGFIHHDTQIKAGASVACKHHRLCLFRKDAPFARGGIDQVAEHGTGGRLVARH